MAGTETQRRVGYEDSPQRGLEDWEDMTGSAPGPWARRYLEEAPTQVHDWLVGMGVSFDHLDMDAGTPVHRRHYPRDGSQALVRVLLDALEHPPRTGTWVTDLLVEDGSVQGVVVRQSEGSWQTPGTPLEIRARAVILGAEAQMVALAETSPCAIRPTYHKYGRFPADADVVTDLEALGVRIVQPESIGAYAHLLAQPPYPPLAVEHALWIDAAGASFFDAAHANSIDSGATLMAQPGCRGWALWDQGAADKVLTYMDEGQPERALAEGTSLHRAETLDAVALQAGFDPAGLQASIPPSRRAELEPPFWAARLGLAVGKSFGGVATDLDACVVDQAGQAIPGLYAAGELAGMAGGAMAAPHGFDGSLGVVLLSGRVAGRSAATQQR